MAAPSSSPQPRPELNQLSCLSSPWSRCPSSTQPNSEGRDSGRWAQAHQRLHVYLPGPPGRRYPFLQGRCRPRGQGPAPSPGDVAGYRRRFNDRFLQGQAVFPEPSPFCPRHPWYSAWTGTRRCPRAGATHHAQGKRRRDSRSAQESQNDAGRPSPTTLSQARGRESPPPRLPRWRRQPPEIAASIGGGAGASSRPCHERLNDCLAPIRARRAEL